MLNDVYIKVTHLLAFASVPNTV